MRLGTARRALARRSSALFVVLALASSVAAQAPPKLSAGVRSFAKVNAETTALRHVRVIDGTGAAPRENQTLVLSGAKIAALGDDATTAVPQGAEVLELAGYTVIPGLVGMHEHMYYPTPGGSPPMYGEHATSFPRLYL